MKRRDFGEQKRLAIIRLCHSGLDSKTLRDELLKQLAAVVPFSYAYFSTTDPATQLSTSSVLVEPPPAWCMGVFIENEFLQEDFNKFNDLLNHNQTVAVLSEATGMEMTRSLRYQNILLPLGMDDELRAVFVADGVCWGQLCLHREDANQRFTTAEAAYVAQLAPHFADGLRKALLLSDSHLARTPDEPGVLILNGRGEVVATTAAAEYWLGELRAMEKATSHPLPVAIHHVVVQLKAIESGLAPANATPKVRLYTRAGKWLVLYASRLRSAGGEGHISVIFEMAQPAEVAPLIMQAYELTKREGEVTQCVLRGWTTSEIATRLHISQHTVQDHLKAIFEKVSVNSRGELAASLFRMVNL